MSARGRDLATRMVDLLDDTTALEDARDVARLLVALFAETVGAHRVSLQVRIPEPDRFATLGVLGHQHFSSTLQVPADEPGLVPLLNSHEPLWAQTRRESQATMRQLLGENTGRVPDLENCPPHLLATALRTPQRIVGSVMLSSGPDGFRLGDVTLTSLLARYSGAVLSRTSVATVFDDTGRLTACTLVSDREGRSPDSTAASPVVGPLATSHPATHPSVRLTTRQLEVLVAIAAGATNAQVADDLALSVHTVRTHRRHLMEQFGAHTSTALIAKARAAGILGGWPSPPVGPRSMPRSHRTTSLFRAMTSYNGAMSGSSFSPRKAMSGPFQQLLKSRHPLKDRLHAGPADDVRSSCDLVTCRPSAPRGGSAAGQPSSLFTTDINSVTAKSMPHFPHAVDAVIIRK